MNKTRIEYLDYTWNPIAMRCDRISPACDHCWHLLLTDRLAKNPTIHEKERAAYAGLDPVLKMDELSAPQRRRKPAVIGVQFMGDLWHVKIPDSFREVVIDTIRACPQHTFLLLTKRTDDFKPLKYGIPKNAWIGFTAENQEWFNRRWSTSGLIVSDVIWLSLEPLLGPIVLPGDFLSRGNHSFVTIGQETGPGARHAKAEWFNDIILQCKAASVPVFVKKAPDGVPIIREFPK